MAVTDEALLALSSLIQSAGALDADKRRPWMGDELRAKLSKMLDEYVMLLGPYWGVTIGQLVGQLIRTEMERG